MAKTNNKNRFPVEAPKIDESAFLKNGKMPPFSEEAETKIISSLLFDPEAPSEVMTNFSRDWFYFEKNAIIYDACYELFVQSLPIDIISVKAIIERMGKMDAIGGIMGLMVSADKFVSLANLEYSRRYVHEMYIKRKLIQVGSIIQQKGFDSENDAFDILEYTQEEMFALMESIQKRKAASFASITFQCIDELGMRMLKKEGVTGVPTGFYQLDELTSGWQKQNLIVVGARPGMGKTALALSLAVTGAKSKHPVGIFSLEMSAQELTFRMLSMETNTFSDKIRSGRLSKSEFDSFASQSISISSLPIFIDDSAGLSVFELKAKLRRMITEHGIKLVIIDYLQLMKAGEGFRGNREQEISTISRNCKEMAKEFDLPIILLSQLSRAVESRGKGNIPMLSDLRESGAIEQDADMVIFPHRPEYYKEEMLSDGGTPAQGMAELHIAKQRNGRLGAIIVRYEQEFTRFSQYIANGHMGFGNNSDPIKPNFQPSTKFDYKTKQSNDDILGSDDAPF
jgi:replicative DNA helicase